MHFSLSVHKQTLCVWTVLYCVLSTAPSTLGQTAANPAIVPISSDETRGESAGWGVGRTWLDQHHDILRITEQGDADVVLLGDSITQSWGEGGRRVAATGQAARAEHLGAFRLGNFGVSGDRTEHVLWRIEHGEFDGLTPKVVVLMIGTNNLTEGHTPKQTAEGVTAIIDKLVEKLPQTQVLLMGVLPRGRAADDPMRLRAKKLNAQIASLGERTEVVYLNLDYAFLNRDGSAKTELFADDFLHLRSVGYEVWGEALVPMIAQLTKASTEAPASSDDLHLQVGALPTDSRNSFQDHQARVGVLTDPDWHTWGCGVIKDGGAHHLFVARWPKEKSFRAWLTHSQVDHFIADRPDGPYRFADTALRGRGGDHWDAITAHNPKIKKFDDRYYLYYIATHVDAGQPLDEAKLTEIAKTGYTHPMWKVLRTNQRTGVAVADSLNGPWRQLDAPIVEPDGPIATLTVNPAVTQRPNGEYLMIVKGDRPDTTHFLRNQALATSRNPTGPFVIYPKPVIDGFDTEDCSIWRDNHRNRYYAVYHAHHRIGLVTSANGFEWTTAKHETLTPKLVTFDDGATIKPRRMERPFVLPGDNGEAAVLFVSALIDGHACNLHLPLSAGNDATDAKHGQQ